MEMKGTEIGSRGEGEVNGGKERAIMGSRSDGGVSFRPAQWFPEEGGRRRYVLRLRS